MRGRKPTPLLLEPHVQQELETLIRRHNTPQQIVLRARIVLRVHQGKNPLQIAHQLTISPDRVRHWRKRWCQVQEIPPEELSRTARLADAPRPGLI